MAEETSSSSSAPPIGDNASMASALGADEAIAPTIFADGEVAIASGMGMESSNIHTLAASSGTIEASTEDKPQFTTIDEADRHLPVANISRIMKKVLPTNAQVSKDTKSYIQLCVSEFISFITSEASDKCMQEKRKTINGDDVLWALSAMGFDNYSDPLRVYLKKYRDALKAPSSSSSSKGATDSTGESPQKKQKVQSSSPGRLPMQMPEGDGV